MMCEKAKRTALKILKDELAPYWDKAEAESYLKSEAIRPFFWVNGKALAWRVETDNGVTYTEKPTQVFGEWLREALAEA